MILKLKWKDYKDNIYYLGALTYMEGKYYFKINETNLKKAMENGCYGIGNLNLDNKFHVSETLFDFFKVRIPSSNRVDIQSILKNYGLAKYDEMELLKVTNGLLMTDNFFITE